VELGETLVVVATRLVARREQQLGELASASPTSLLSLPGQGRVVGHPIDEGRGLGLLTKPGDRLPDGQEQLLQQVRAVEGIAGEAPRGPVQDREVGAQPLVEASPLRFGVHGALARGCKCLEAALAGFLHQWSVLRSIGSRTRMVVPLPGPSDKASILPPIAWTSASTTKSPSPVPWRERTASVGTR